MAGRIPEADIIEVRLALCDGGVELISYVLSQTPNRKLSNRKEARWGRNGSFSLGLTGSKRGLWFDFEAQEGGDLFDLIRLRVTGGGFSEVYLWVRNWLGWPVDGPIPVNSKSDQRRHEQAQKEAQREAEEAEEKRRKVAYAKHLWGRSQPAAGTPAETYLTSTRKIPMPQWPEAVAYDPVERALIVKVTSEAGEVVGVQLVRLTAEGEKIPKTEGGKLVKQSHGWLAGGAVRLPAVSGSEVLCLAEGPETGLTVWAATGHETWIALGSLSRLTLSCGRKIVLLRDDDRRDAPSQRKLKTTLREWRQADLDFVSAWPWAIRRGDKTDFNDLIKAAGPQAVKERISLTADPQPVMAQRLVPVAEARLTLDRCTAEFFSAAKNLKEGAEPPVHALGVSLGTGKTETAITHAIRVIHELRAKGSKKAVVFASPEHSLNVEVADRIRSHQEAGKIRVAIWRGRESRLPGTLSDEKMCGDVESIREAATMKVEADEVCEECPLTASCHYLAQRKQDADIWLVAHPMLFQEDPKPIKRRGVAAVVVDESPWVPGLIGVEGKGVLVYLDSLDPGVLPKPLGIEGERLEDNRQRLKRALIGQPLGPVTRSALKAVGFDSETGRAASKAEWRRKADGGHWRERVENKSLGAMSKLWNSVSDLMSRKDDEASGWVSLTRAEEGALALRLAGRKPIGGAWRVPTLLIDASLDEDLLRHFWPTVEVTGRIEVETRHQRITQIAHPFSKDMLVPREKSDPTKEARRAKNRLKVSAFIQKLDRQGGKTLVVSNKATIEALRLPSFIATAHFNAVAGKDVWGDVDRVIVVGRTQPSPSTVERMVEALTGRPCEPVEGWYPRQDVWRLQAVPGGVQRVLSEGVRHPGPIAEKIRNRICEAEVMQAIGRGRGVNRTGDRPLEVIVLSDAVLPVPVDRFASLDEALKTSANDEMLALGGVAYEDPTAAHEAYPDLWPTLEAAKKALQRQNTGTFWYNDVSIPKCPPDRVAEVVYQRAGAKRRKGRALVDFLIKPDPRAAIEAALGELAFFEKLDV